MSAAAGFHGFRAEQLPEQHDQDGHGVAKDSRTKSKSRHYYVGGEGAPLILLHELPGLSRQTFALGDYFVQRGFRVSLPLLFGRAGDYLPLRGIAKICLRQELRELWLGNDTTITDWIRELAAHELSLYKKTHPHASRVGVIGMCYTGSMVLALMLEKKQDKKDKGAISPLVTPVLAQPSSCYPRDALNQISEQGSRGPALALRFEKDWICCKSQLSRLEQAFAACAARDPSQTLTVVELEGKGHSTLVYDYEQDNPFRRDLRSGQLLDARDVVLQFLRNQMEIS
jgi:dienelactone hydrolase